jgi:peptidoglycan/xylan/chitin deacetylase (PgdA/CDA1 family)/uncharacterized protein (DUF2062 family)
MITGVAAVGAVFMWAILHRNSSILIKTFYRGDPAKKTVALRFDDSPDPRYTPQALDILKRHGAKANFFCIGRFAEANPELVARMHREGHLIANHTYEHSWRVFYWMPHTVRSSVVACGGALQKITGYFPRFYGPPVGIKTPPQALVGWQLGLAIVGWTRWAVDGGGGILTKGKVGKLVKDARNGDVFLLHDAKINVAGHYIVNEAHGAAMQEHLPALIEGLRARDFTIVTLDELFGLSRELEPAPTADEGPLASTWSMLKAMGHAFMYERLSPLNVSFSLALGIVIGCSPFFGAHLPIGLAVASRFSLSKLAVIIGTNISNPITGPFVILGSIQVGWRIMNGSWITYGNMTAMYHESALNLANEFIESWMLGFPIVGALVGVVAMGVCFPALWAWRAMRADG